MQRVLGGDTDRIIPPRSWGNKSGAFLTALGSPWYSTVADLNDIVFRATVEHAHAAGLKALNLPLTTRTITCPTGLGSDSEPVAVTVGDVDTYLSDSIQFALEYGCRIATGGCYAMLPSFRGEKPDQTHLNQFAHNEAEIAGGLDDLIRYVESYVRHLAGAVLREYEKELLRTVPDVSHLVRMAGARGPFPRLTFDEAASALDGSPGCIEDHGTWRTLTRRGEHRLMERIGEFVWVTHFDHLSVPFYQAFGDPEGRTAACADLFFGMGEVVGSGERHRSGDEIRRALDVHQVPEHDYAWYTRMKDRFPMRTAGFGMGVERFLMWVLDHDDIRDMPLISRVDEEEGWPAAVERP